MEKASEILGRTLRRMDDPAAARAWLDSTWTTLVGKAMASHIAPLACGKGVLRVEADSREWQNQAKAMSKEICERVNRSWGGVLIQEVRVECAPRSGKRPAHEIDNEHTPFIRRKAARHTS
ncbi:MAG TPA: DUF721 domain-containing protein [Candidatus Acidoferrales bacterium]|nr:DUF721 domain-containing protein [Candidatus Acidoferrales bacterium]